MVREPDPSLINAELAPTPPESRTWSAFHLAALWIGMVVCVPTYTLAGGLVDLGMNWWQAVLTILLGNLVVLVPMVLNGHAGTKHGIPFPVLTRASFGIRGAHVPAILHAEMDCLENAGRLTARDYARSTLYSTLSPCDMCSGTALLYKIPRIVIGENRTFRGPEDHVRSRGVELTIVDDPECARLMAEFIRAHPEVWNEDIGV